MHGDPNIFVGRSLTFLILSIITKSKKFCTKEVLIYFAFTIHMGSNCYIKTGVHDLQVAFFKANST